MFTSGKEKCTNQQQQYFYNNKFKRITELNYKSLTYVSNISEKIPKVFKDDNFKNYPLALLRHNLKK